METNIAEILKDKPKGVKLSSPIFGKCEFNTIYKNTYKGGTGTIEVKVNNSEEYFDETGKYYCSGSISHDGKPLLFPSEEMRDWSKFAWKRGDVLVDDDKIVHIIFEGFDDDTYISFKGKHYLWEEGNEEDYSKEEANMATSLFEKANYESAQAYINAIEEKLGGKLNLETLEIEKPQPEFKDGDIVFVESHMLGINTSSMIAIFRKEEEIDKYKFSPALCESNEHDTYLREDSVVLSPSGIKIFRPATDSEKQQLFDALAKENKAWDTEKKQIIDLKPKVELKPFDKVVVRCSEADRWSIDFFSYKVSNGYICTGDAWFKYCLPYNEETAKLIGTTNNAK